VEQNNSDLMLFFLQIPVKGKSLNYAMLMNLLILHLMDIQQQFLLMGRQVQEKLIRWWDLNH